MDTSAAAATGDNKRRLNKRGRNGQKRLHLRKTAVQPRTMQRQDKRGPKKIAEEWERRKAWPSSKKTPQETQQSRRRRTKGDDGGGGGNALRFTCPQCRDNLEYAPKDLVRHFEQKHRGSPPVFPCHACAFNTHEFSSLQVHLLSHKDTFSSCSICDDNIQRTWPEFSAHLSTCHCQNGKYSCEMCQRFSTGDIRVFLEHMYVHNLGLEGASDDLPLLHAKDKNQLGPKRTTQTLRCQHCGYEASQKWLMTKHIKTVHVCQNGNQRKKKKELHSIAMKPNDPIPKMKPRLTRSAVREMCWLTQDCLSLPGREFLDKYCHLSDPQTTLEETQQFLMKSVAGETGDQKWTKALKTVLSNVPQDVNHHPKSENGITANSSDLTVLTVKNKITVAQHGAAYGKRLKRMAPSDKETVFPESAADDARRVVDQNGCQSDLNAPLEIETKLHNDVSVSAQTEASECAQMQENRENQEVKSEKDIEEHGKKQQEPAHEDVINISSELRLTNESIEQTFVHKVPPTNKRQRRRRKRKTASKKVDNSSPGLPLKIVLKKNPVKETQWVSQSSLSPSGGGPMDDDPALPSPHGTTETTGRSHQKAPLTEVQQKKWTKGSKTDLRDPAQGVASALPSNPGEGLIPNCAAKPMGSKNMAENEHGVLDSSPSTRQEIQGGAGKSRRFSETGDEKRSSAAKTGQSCSTAGVDNAPLPTSGSGVGCHVSHSQTSSADGATPHSSYTKSSPVSQPVITPQGKVNLEGSSLALCLEQRETDVLPDSSPDLLSSPSLLVGKAIHKEPSPASGHRWQPVPKTQERTLKLVAINPSQLVKRPAGDQPVVVLNHPDADIPEVARIMEVINRYRGEVQKVMLSRKTLKALSAMGSKVAETNDPTDVPPDSVELGDNYVQERFILKMKLRRLSRKKYEVVGAVSPSRDAAAKFRCWFCGRVFASQETWMIHRQRHLMEWKRPNCENS